MFRVPYVLWFNVYFGDCASSMKELFLAIVSIISALLLVLILVGLGWYLVWRFFLSRFRFVRELLGGMTESTSVNDLKNGRLRIKKTRRE